MESSPSKPKSAAATSAGEEEEPNDISFLRMFVVYFVLPMVFLAMMGGAIRWFEIQPSSLSSEEYIQTKQAQKEAFLQQAREVLEEQKKTATPEKKKPTATQAEEVSRKNSQSRKSTTMTNPDLIQMEERIAAARNNYKNNPESALFAWELAEILLQKGISAHASGGERMDAVKVYEIAISLTKADRQRLQKEGKPTNVRLDGGVSNSLNEEIVLDHGTKSIDGQLCEMQVSLGQLFESIMSFESAVEAYTQCLEEVDENYMEALFQRASSLLKIGDLKQAGSDYSRILSLRKNLSFLGGNMQLIYSGLTTVLRDNEENVPGGWGALMQVIPEMYAQVKEQFASLTNSNDQQQISLIEELKELHFVMFLYHDLKTKNTEEAWKHLKEANRMKEATSQPYNRAFMEQRSQSIQDIFDPTFWPKGIGSELQTPIFIIGFDSYGSTLLENILNNHHSISGIGSGYSVFGNQINKIRDAIVKASTTVGGNVPKVVNDLAQDVVTGMIDRWSFLHNATEIWQETPLRLVDTLSANYNSIGFIHMLFPKALILHLVRNPMDVLFSLYHQQDCPLRGGLLSMDHTGDFESLSHMYKLYRDMMDHWNKVLPGRIHHIRYDDILQNLHGTTRALVDVTGLEQDETMWKSKKDTLDKDLTQAWRKYEPQLQPLLQLVGDQLHYEQKTTLHVS